MEKGIQGTLSERAKYILDHHPELMNSIIDYITQKEYLTEAHKKLLSDIITRFETSKT